MNWRGSLDWQVNITQTAEKQISSFDKPIQRRIIDFLKRIKYDPRCSGKSLKGNMAKFWRYRIGDYRLICVIEEENYTVKILEAGHRKNIYL